MSAVQVGADTHIRVDIDAGAGVHSSRTLVVLQNVVATDLIARNFAPSWSPSGVGETITGSPLADTLAGTESNDTISGAGLADSITGGGGNDSLSGGSFRDTLVGGLGFDTLIGGDGRDSLLGGVGADTIFGDGGDDTINDRAGANLIDAGSGDDYIDNVGGGSTDPGGADTITLGAGNDTLRLDFAGIWSYPANQHADVVLDFTAGLVQARDVVDVGEFFGGYFIGYVGNSNPFATGYFRLIDGGIGNTLLQYDRDGVAATFDWLSLLDFRGVAPTAFSAANFTNGARAWGPVGTGYNLSGSVLADTMVGSSVADTLIGLGGADNLNGGLGDDSLDGGSGNDVLQGNEGNDTQSGGDGNDSFANGTGDDSLIGGAGDDSFGDYEGNNTHDGGAGNDYFDYVSFQNAGVDRIFTGTGQDTIRLWYNYAVGTADTVVDFTTGAGGDVLTSFDWYFENLAAGENPFLNGYLRLRAVGPDTVLEYDRDGAGGATYTWRALINFEGVTPGSFTRDNFSFVQSPLGQGLTLNVSELSQRIYGTNEAHTNLGFQGNDTL